MTTALPSSHIFALIIVIIKLAIILKLFLSGEDFMLNPEEWHLNGQVKGIPTKY